MVFAWCATCEFVPYEFVFLYFSIPVSGRMSSSGRQKFSDFESDIMTGWVAYGRLVGATHASGLLVWNVLPRRAWLAGVNRELCLLLGS
jgi:hypothetical protein